MALVNVFAIETVRKCREFHDTANAVLSQLVSCCYSTVVRIWEKFEDDNHKDKVRKKLIGLKRCVTFILLEKEINPKDNYCKI